MRESDWYQNDDEEEFGEALHHRTEELYSVQDAYTDEDGFIECPVLPLRDLVVFPHMVAPIFVGRESSLLAIEEAQLENQTMIALTQRDADEENPDLDGFIPIGTEIAVGRLLNMPDGSSSALVQAPRRVELVEFVRRAPFLVAKPRPIYENERKDHEIEATMRTALELFHKCVQLNRSLPEEAYLFAMNIEEPAC